MMENKTRKLTSTAFVPLSIRSSFVKTPHVRSPIKDINRCLILIDNMKSQRRRQQNIILLSEGQILYQGPRESVLDFFEFMGFKCPERKGVAEFLQEVRFPIF